MHRDMASTAQCLRMVKRARQRFLAMWWLQRLAMLRRPALLDRDIDRQIADPHNRNWSILYLGSILDD
jgi:hypothetical protein